MLDNRPIFNSPQELPNLDFSKGLLHWYIKPEELNAISVTVDKEEGLRVRSYKGLWEVHYKPLLRIGDNKYYTLEVEAKCNFKKRRFLFSRTNSDFLIIEAVPLDLDLKPLELRLKEWKFGDPGEPFFSRNLGRWACGRIAICGKRDWNTFRSFFKVPSEAKFLSIVINGGGIGEVCIRKIKLNVGIPQGILTEAKASPFKRVPQARIFKKLRLGSYAGKFLRIGDLNGDGRLEFIFAQNEKIGPGNIYKHITCLTAIDLDGNILWQIGHPDINNYEVTSDLPIGVIDINDDGKDEVVCCMNFEILILDGSSGRILKRRPTPKSREGGGFCEGPEILFERVLGDCIAFCDLRGLGKDRDFLLKDRYNNIWAFTSDLEELWSYSGKLIHYPLVFDIDGDGRDEVFVGDALLDHNGKPIWTIDLYDHCDSAVIYEYNGKLILAIANQDGGFYFIDALTGEIIKEYHLGHAQVLSLGYFEPSIKHPLICAQTYWGGLNQFLFNLNGDLIYAKFGEVYGWVPVNWIGDGTELLASSKGLYDCYGNLVVPFPEPLLESKWGAKVFIWDVCNDPRDEVIVWDENYLVIYTQSNRVKGRVYKPLRKLYNQTFYGNFISKPNWVEVV